jgi:pimeloyl-ACP methyl ester carboxylesterase
MNEYPLFVPCGGEHLAAVLAVPEADPRGLVLLLPALGLGRSHKNRMWTRAALSLAERNIASVRVDFPGHGDSTGATAAGLLDRPALEEATAVARVARELTGAEPMGVAGNCYGARTAVAFAQHEDACTSAALVMAGGFDALLERRPRSTDRPPTPERSLRTSARKAVRRALTRGKRRDGEPRRRFIPEVGQALARTDLLFVLPAIAKRQDLIREAIENLPARTGGGAGGHISVELLRSANAASANIPVESQPALVDILTAWMDRTMPGRAPDRAPAALVDEP